MNCRIIPVRKSTDAIRRVEMAQVTIEEAASRLSDLITETPVGEEIILTRNSLPIAKLIPLQDRPRPRRGSGKTFIRRIADDFDAVPEGFEEYMP